MSEAELDAILSSGEEITIELTDEQVAEHYAEIKGVSTKLTRQCQIV